MNLEERTMVYAYRQAGKSVRWIACELARSPSTISRELRRNLIIGNRYFPDKAHRMARNRARGRPAKKILPGTVEFSRVLEGIRSGWSAEQISGRYELTHPGKMLSHETVYRFMQSEEGRKLGAWEYITWQRKTRKHRTGRRKGKRVIIPDRTGIEKRPAGANDRTEFGHFEADLICFSRQRGTILNIVERKTRFGFATLASGKHTDVVCGKITSLLSEFGNWPGALKSVTFDNGTEFVDHGKVAEALAIKTYFCHPYSSWERGTVENSNGIFRRYTPRKTDLSTLDSREVSDIRMEMNNRPLKVLGWRTPAEVLKEELLHYLSPPSVALHT